jgi:hypothetical protein
MKHLLRMLAIVALLAITTGSAPGAWGAPQFVGIRAYDIQARSHFDDKGTFHYADYAPLAGARAWICVKDNCAWYTTGADGIAGVWLDWGTLVTVIPAPPTDYRQCTSYSVVAWAGAVGQSAIMQDQVWTGWCSAGDTNPCPVQGCSPQLTP